MKIKSIFENKGEIPKEYTCDGSDKIPVLEINGVPANAKTLALIMDDPDAPNGTWDHWILYNIPATVSKIDKQIGVAGKNSWGRLNYGGPCPPNGTHRYYFRLYALDVELALTEGCSKQELLKAMNGHIIEKAELMGTYKR